MPTMQMLLMALKGFLKRDVTTRYPLKPMPKLLKGFPDFISTKCIGCFACSLSCPQRAISVIDSSDERLIEIFYGKCILCGTCTEVCPESGVEFSSKFEVAVTDRLQAKTEISHSLLRCAICGRPVVTGAALSRLVDRLRAEGYSDDSIKGITELIHYCDSCRSRLLLERGLRREES